MSVCNWKGEIIFIVLDSENIYLSHGSYIGLTYLMLSKLSELDWYVVVFLACVGLINPSGSSCYSTPYNLLKYLTVITPNSISLNQTFFILFRLLVCKRSH